MNALHTLALVSLALVGCGPLEGDCGRPHVAEEIDRVAGSPAIEEFALSELTSFDWDRVHAFGPYSGEEWIKENTGLDVDIGHWPFHRVAEDTSLFVFSKGGEVVCMFEAGLGQTNWAFLGDTRWSVEGLTTSQTAYVVNREGSIVIFSPSARAE